MKIIFFSAQYLPTVGGVERYTHAIAVGLIEKGHEVTVVTSALPNMPEEEVCDGIHIIRLPVIPVMNGRFPVLRPNAKLVAFQKWFSQQKPELCVIQTRFYPNSIMAAALCSKYSYPAIVIEHGTAYLLRDGILGAFGRLYEHLACRYVRAKCSHFYGVSAACCQWLKRFGVHTDRVLYNSVDPDELVQLAAKGQKALAERLGNVFSGQKMIAFSARFIPEKGVKQLLTAFEQIRQKHPETVLVMAGDGPLWEECKQRNASGVFLTGRLSYEENLALIQRADAFCLPTFSEGFATTVLEAAALKTIVVTTPVGGSPELILNGEYGVLIESMEPECIYRGLMQALEGDDYRAVAAENAFNRLNQCFTWQATSAKLERIAQTGASDWDGAH